MRIVADHYSLLLGSPPASRRDAAWTDERGATATSEEGRRPRQAPRHAGVNVSKIAREPEPGPAVARQGYGVRQLTWDGLADAGWLRSAGVSVNDLLIGALMITVGDWNAAHGRKPGLIRITMPVGDRAQAGADGVWANASRLTSVTARAPGSAAVLGLLADVAAQTRYAKEHSGPQVDLFSRVLASAPIPVVIKDRVLRTALGLGGSFLCDTCLVSNLGVVEPIRFGTVDASQLWFSTFAHTAGALHLTFRYRRALLSDRAAADFADRYADALGRLARREVTS
jgi:hypothetical protein